MTQPKVHRAAIVSRIKDLLTAATGDLQKKIKLSDYLTAAVPYDYHYLSAVFSQVEKTTIEQHYITLKIERVKKMLEAGELSISEISYKCGYSSPAHLTNQFKKSTGKTPSQFQKELRENERNK